LLLGESQFGLGLHLGLDFLFLASFSFGDLALPSLFSLPSLPFLLLGLPP
jgi:hypothetical protein